MQTIARRILRHGRVGFVSLAIIALPCRGSDYTITWHTLTGGGLSTNTVYAVRGCVGQSVAGTSSTASGSYTVHAELPSWIGLVQIPTSPRLSIARVGANVLVSWPSRSVDFVLQETTDLTGEWSSVQQSPADDGTTRRIVLPVVPGKKFFRLIKP